MSAVLTCMSGSNIKVRFDLHPLEMFQFVSGQMSWRVLNIRQARRLTKMQGSLAINSSLSVMFASAHDAERNHAVGSNAATAVTCLLCNRLLKTVAVARETPPAHDESLIFTTPKRSPFGTHKNAVDTTVLSRLPCHLFGEDGRRGRSGERIRQRRHHLQVPNK